MPSGKIPLVDFQGLVTAPGLLARSPASCTEVFNFEFPAPGFITKRRGFERLAGNTGGPVWKLLTSRLMGASVLAHVGTGVQGTQLRYGDGTAMLTTLSTVDAGALTRTRATRMQGAVCQRNYYATANEGVARVESDIGVGPVRYAGMPRGMPLFSGSIIAGTALANGFARAYRVTWHRLDADGVELGGAPTSRMVVSNATYMGGTGVTAAARVQFGIPWEWGTINTALTTAYFWKLWGTRSYDETNQVGDDEMGLIATAFLTAPQIAAGNVTYDDNTPDSYLSNAPRLHTNTNNFPPVEVGLLQGIANEDAPPPVANDVAYWQDVMWYADTTFRSSITVAMIALMADGDTVTFTTAAGSVTLTARNAPALPNEFLRISTAPTPAINIRETTRFMLDCLRRRSFALALGVAGYTTGTATQQSGLFQIEVTKPQSLLFDSSNPAIFQTFAGYSLGTTITGDAQSNRLVWSKPLRADAVPPVNQLTAGPRDGRILRAFPFRERLVLFTDYGIYQVTGRTFADFSVSAFDLGYRLIGRDLVAMCDEKLYAWCYEGIIEIDDSGVRVISTPIEPTIENLLVSAGGGSSMADGLLALASIGFATAFRQRHQVRFHYPEAFSLSLNGCFQWLAFDTRTRIWSVGTFGDTDVDGFLDNRACAVVRFSDDRLVFGNWSSGADTRLFLERMTYTQGDYRDNSIDGKSLPIASSLSLQYQDPQHAGAQHWQQTVISWDAGELSWRPLPSSILVAHSTETDDGLTTVAVSELLTRIETPQTCRRGNRLKVSIQHNVIDEYCGIVGIEQQYRDGTRFGRKVTP